MEQQVVASFIPNRRLRVPLRLDRVCLDVDCSPEATCRRGDCEPAMQDSSTFAAARPGEELSDDCESAIDMEAMIHTPGLAQYEYTGGCIPVELQVSGSPEVGHPQLVDPTSAGLMLIHTPVGESVTLDFSFASPLSSLSFQLDWLSFREVEQVDERLAVLTDGNPPTVVTSSSDGTVYWENGALAATSPSGSALVGLAGPLRVVTLTLTNTGPGDGTGIYLFNFRYDAP